MQGLADRISAWIAAWVQETDRKGAVVGLSGGVDSTVTAALCKRALGDHVLGVIMPCESAREDEKDALLVAERLDICTTTVRLDKPFLALAALLPHSEGLARANLKPRLRMAVLYYLANAHSCLVVGTGNKSALMLGYFTKYGDGGADVLPLGGLYKTEVLELAEELGVPEKIIRKPPSAGLWQGQSDEDEISLPYEQVDTVLEALRKRETAGVAPALLRRVQEMVRVSNHKRAVLPVFEIERAALAAKGGRQ